MMFGLANLLPFNWMFPRGIEYLDTETGIDGERKGLSDKQWKKRKSRLKMVRESRRRNR